jgi:hypothetical protein
MSTNPISSQFPSNPIIMQQTPNMIFQTPIDMQQNMMPNLNAQVPMMQPVMNPNDIDPSKFFY